MAKLYPIMFLLLLCACTPRVVSYCEGRGFAPQTPQWARCYERFERNQALFAQDRAPCEVQAEQVYPDSLYDPDRYVRRPAFGRYGEYRGSRLEFEEGDWWQHRQVDNLRHTIIASCMAKKGWNDADKWELGGRKLR